MLDYLSASNKTPDPLLKKSGPGGAPYHLISGPAPLRGASNLAGMKKTQVSRCWRGAKPKYRDLFKDSDVKRWYGNVSRGSRITVDVYLRRLGSICRSRGMKNPKDLLALATRGGGTLWAYNFIMDLVTKLEAEGKAGSYIHSNTKALRSWFAHNGINVEGRIRIKGAQDAPSLKDKHAPTSSWTGPLFLRTLFGVQASHFLSSSIVPPPPFLEVFMRCQVAQR